MADFVKEKGVEYPVAVDVASRTKEAFAVDSFPDYYLIDRAGNLRVADLANSDLERAVQKLLAEPAPPSPASSTAPSRLNSRRRARRPRSRTSASS